MVDADEAIRRSAHHLLGSQGATVETARDAHEAIALARQTPYSAALVDIRLPDLDGYETYQAAPRGPARRADHPDDGVRLGPVALDRQGPPGGPADGPLQALPRRPPDGGRRAGAPPPRRPPRPAPGAPPRIGHAQSGSRLAPDGVPPGGRPAPDRFDPGDAGGIRRPFEASRHES